MSLVSFCKLQIFIFIFVSLPIFANSIEINFAYQNTDNYPFQTQNSQETNWKKPGILLEMFKLLEKELNITIQFKRYPWKRALFKLKNGSIQGVFSASYKSKRLEFGRYPRKNGEVDIARRTHYNAYFLYKLKDSSITWDGKKFKNVSKRICAEREYSIVDDLKKIGMGLY